LNDSKHAQKVYRVRPELLAYNPFPITNNQRTIVINIQQDFIDRAHDDLFQGQADRGLIYKDFQGIENHLSKEVPEQVFEKKNGL
jgi:hypothetical protein